MSNLSKLRYASRAPIRFKSEAYTSWLEATPTNSLIHRDVHPAMSTLKGGSGILPRFPFYNSQRSIWTLDEVLKPILGFAPPACDQRRIIKYSRIVKKNLDLFKKLFKVPIVFLKRITLISAANFGLYHGINLFILF